MTNRSQTEAALFARLQRKLKPSGQTLHRCREQSRDFAQLGRFYVVDADLNAVMAKDVDLADWLEAA